MFSNPQDPLLNHRPEAEVALFKRIVDTCVGFPNDYVFSAAVNIIINVVRKTFPTRKAALDQFDLVMTQARNLLASHYQTDGDSRRNIFPFDQVIQVGFNDLRPKDRR